MIIDNDKVNGLLKAAEEAEAEFTKLTKARLEAVKKAASALQTATRARVRYIRALGHMKSLETCEEDEDIWVAPAPSSDE